MAVKAEKPRPFKLFVNYFDHPKGRVWAVAVGRDSRWKTGVYVHVLVPLRAVFDKQRYKQKLQPFAWLEGRGIVEKSGTGLLIR